jgi:hypothetical protein
VAALSRAIQFHAQPVTGKLKLEDRSATVINWIDHVRYAVRDGVVMFTIRAEHDTFFDVDLPVDGQQR